MTGALLVNGRYTKGVSFLSKMVYKRLRCWTTGWSLPVHNFVECPPPPPASAPGSGHKMNHNTRKFFRFFHSHNLHLLALLGLFTDRNDRFPTLSYISTGEISTLEYRAFSLTWPASMEIYWNKTKRFYMKRVELPQDWLGTPTWPPWHHAKTLYTWSLEAWKR